MKRTLWHCVSLFLVTIIIGEILIWGLRLWPDSLLRFFAPQNASVWELSKIGFWPSLAAAIFCCAAKGSRKNFPACLALPAALPVILLCIYWFTHLLCGIAPGLGDNVAWVLLLAGGCILAFSGKLDVWLERAYPMVAGLVLIWAFAYTVFALCPVPVPLFSETFIQGVMAPILW